MNTGSFEIQGPNMRLVSDRAVKAAVQAVCRQALKDCNKYCKMDAGALIESSVIHSDDNSGELVWDMPYAEYQYDLPSTHTDKNPLACPKWCEVAENNHGSEWEQIFVDTLNREGL